MQIGQTSMDRSINSLVWICSNLLSISYFIYVFTPSGKAGCNHIIILNPTFPSLWAWQPQYFSHFARISGPYNILPTPLLAKILFPKVKLQFTIQNQTIPKWLLLPLSNCNIQYIMHITNIVMFNFFLNIFILFKVFAVFSRASLQSEWKRLWANPTNM